MIDKPTLDGMTQFRCMLVGLEDSLARECTQALRPLVAIRVADVRDACTKISDILPLVVLVPDAMTAGDMGELGELAEACGSEIIHVGRPFDVNRFGHILLEAIQKAETRRVAR